MRQLLVLLVSTAVILNAEINFASAAKKKQVVRMPPAFREKLLGLLHRSVRNRKYIVKCCGRKTCNKVEKGERMPLEGNNRTTSGKKSRSTSENTITTTTSTFVEHTPKETISNEVEQHTTGVTELTQAATDSSASAGESLLDQPTSTTQEVHSSSTNQPELHTPSESESSSSVHSTQMSSNATTSMVPLQNASLATLSGGNSSTTRLNVTILTSTQAPKCEKPDCAAFNSNFQQFPAVSVAGRYLRGCGKSYFLAYDNPMNISEAASYCLSQKMLLLAVETIAEINCLGKLVPPEIKAVATSGLLTANGTCKYWCSLDNFVTSEVSAKFITPNTSSDTACVSFNHRPTVDSSNLTSIGCSSTGMPFVCEQDCKPKCPNECSKNVTWDQNWKTCCGLGMLPLFLDTPDEQQCLHNETWANWKGNYNYWTAGTQLGCKGAWDWCERSGSRAVAEELRWEAGQPDNKGGRQDCLHLRLHTNATKHNLGWYLTDRNCTDKYILACKGVTSGHACSACPTSACVKNSSLFNGSKLIDIDSQGLLTEGCGRNILFSKEKATWMEARDACCQKGMSLLILPSRDKTKCFHQMISRVSKMPDRDLVLDEFWLLGSKGSCLDYVWCSSGKSVEHKELNWAPEDPASLECIFSRTALQNGTVKLFTAGCDVRKRYICEAKKAPPKGQAKQQECIETLGITPDDLNMIYNASIPTSNYTKAQRCFIKCLGEMNDLFASNALIPGNTIQLIEETAADEEELQSGFDTYDECSKIKRNDECDTANDIYDCGRSRKPAMVSSMLSNVESRPEDTPGICVPSLRKCMMDYDPYQPCINDPALVAELEANKSTVMGKLVKLSDGRDIFSSILFNDMDRNTAWDYCCSIGMKLAEVSDPAMLPEFHSKVIIRGLSGPKSVYIMVGETFQVDSSTDAWCRSRINTTLSQFYKNTYTATSGCLPAQNLVIYGRADWSSNFGFFPYKSAYPNGMRFSCEAP